MSGSDHDAPSFDPRTWPGGPGGAAKNGGEAEGPSFDPKSWSTPGDRADSSAATRRSVMAGGGGALLALASGGAWLALRPKAGRPPADQARSGDDGQVQTTVILRDIDQLLAAITSAGASAAEARAATDAAGRALGAVPGELAATVRIAKGGAIPRLASLELRREDGSGVIVSRDAAGAYVARASAARLATRLKVVRGEMDSDSFYTSAVSAGVPDQLISPFARAFAYDFDFQREIKAGDIFEAAFEQQADDQGRVVGGERLLFALIETAANSRALYLARPPGVDDGWFDSRGRSVVRAFLRTPVDGARVTSTFGLRVHPVEHFTKMHRGVDFASPIGTPIYAASDGVVAFAGPKGPNGNFVQIRHDNGWETLYLHLSAFAPDLVAGARVRQGQEIGKVGMTGEATGPHLHYEVHIDGQAVDPMSVKAEGGRALTGLAMEAFVKSRDRVDELRAQQTGG